MKDINNEIELEYYCDSHRHLVCIPYSIPNLHLMAKDLEIKMSWFHRKKGFQHYDIPIKRVKEIIGKCTQVSSRDLVKIVKGQPIITPIN